jgi:hypothetical protein
MLRYFPLEVFAILDFLFVPIACISLKLTASACVLSVSYKP